MGRRLKDRVPEFLACYHAGMSDRDISYALRIPRDSAVTIRYRLGLPEHAPVPRVACGTRGGTRRKARASAGYNVYFARPSQGDLHDLLVEIVGPRKVARARARELNATLPAPEAAPFDFYYASHGRCLLAEQDAYDRLLDAEAEAREAGEAV